MDPITAGLIGTLGPSVLGGLFGLFGGSNRKTSDNAPDLPPVPEWQGFQRQSGVSTAQPQLQDPGSRQAMQDPHVRIAALDQLKTRLGA